MSIQDQDGPHPHRDEAASLLRDTACCGADVATAHALLAVEQRLGELVALQEITATIAAFECGAIGGADYDRAIDTIRGLLGVTTEGERA